MAYMFYKYIRRRVKESKAKKAAHDIADESHLTPEFRPVPASQTEKNETLPHDGTSDTPPRPQDQPPAQSKQESERYNEEQRKLRAYRWRMILGLILPNFLAAVDVTIVAPAIPAISSHFSMPLCPTLGTKLTDQTT